MEKQVGIPLKGNEKGDLAAHHAAVRWQAVGLSFGLMVLMSAFSFSVQSQTVSGNETVEASKQTMELMNVKRVAPVVSPLEKPKSSDSEDRVSTINCRTFPNTLYVNGARYTRLDFFLSLSNVFLHYPSLGGTPAKFESIPNQDEDFSSF